MTVGLGDITNYVYDYRMGGVYTSIPAYIVSVEDKGELRVNVQPALNMRDEEMRSVKERPTILNVPVFMPTSRSGGLSYDFNAGDVCQLIFSMRGLEAWKRGNGYPSTPVSNRRFAAEDAIAYIGGHPFGESPNRPSKHSLRHDPRDVVLYHNLGRPSEVEVRLKYGGGIEVNAPNDTVKITSKMVDIKSPRVEVETPVFNLNGKNLVGHTHGGVESGRSNTSPF